MRCAGVKRGSDCRNRDLNVPADGEKHSFALRYKSTGVVGGAETDSHLPRAAG